jgi:hypothetical protein
MHLQQTKRDSRETGGPQYYFHNLSEVVKTYLRKKGAVPVALVTPYGATKTSYLAVSLDAKIDDKGRIVEGKVGHDRIQQGASEQGIGESIRSWYGLSKGDFERIDVEVEVIDDAFYLTPTIIKQVEAKRAIPIATAERPLTFTEAYISKFWRDQVTFLKTKGKTSTVSWSLREIARIAEAHIKKVPHIQEPDLLRAHGPLVLLGLSLGPYVGKGFDCLSRFRFFDYPEYVVPVEIKRHSSGFKYQMRKYGKDELSRAVILCAKHDLDNVPKNVDVIELQAMGEYLKAV